MTLIQEYRAYKQAYIGPELDRYKFVVDLAQTKFRWFQLDLAGLSYLVELQPGGTAWKAVLLTKGKAQVALEHVSQVSIIHGTPVEQSVFNVAFETAISQLTSKLTNNN